MIFEKQVVNMYKGMMHTRCDDNGTAFYFSAGDFPGLHSEPYVFAASAGHSLKGYLYSYDNHIENRLVVFDHGFGGGHRAYMKEIELLCRHGFLVLSYDHTGCMESGGETPNGMAQSLCDLNDCINSVKNNKRFAGFDISVMGHSWGGFSTLNICALHPEISHIVVLSGFVSVDQLVDSFFKGIMKGYRKPIKELEKASNPKYYECNAINSLSKTSAKTLLIYSSNDQLCNRSHFDLLREKLSYRSNVNFLLIDNKGHNPNYTENAVRLLGEYSKAKAKYMKDFPKSEAENKAFLSRFDWDAMTEQDMTVWEKIFACLDN